MAAVERELIYTVHVDQLRPGDFVARALAFPNVLALGDTEAEAVTRATGSRSRRARSPAWVSRMGRCRRRA